MYRKRENDTGATIETYGRIAGERLKKERLAKGMTLKEVAVILGLSEATISRWESGKKVNMAANEAYKLSILYDVSFEYLCGMNVPRDRKDQKTMEAFDELSNKITSLNYKQLKKTISFVDRMVEKDNVDSER